MAKNIANRADRISSLPRRIMNHILERMPLCDAARMSVVSKKWRHKWLTIPHLVFDRDFENSLHGSQDLMSIISLVLLVHKGTLPMFSLKDTRLGICPALNHWLHFLLNHCTTVLTLQFPANNGSIVMPHHLFEFQQLTELNLQKVEVRPPPTYTKFYRLAILNLIDLKIEIGQLEKFISMCPKLEFLNIYDSSENFNLIGNIISLHLPPTVRYFCYWGGVRVYLSFDNAVCLEELLIGYKTLPLLYGCDFVNFFSQLSSIRRVKVNSFFLQTFASFTVPRKLPNDLSHLTLIQFSSLNFWNVNILKCAICLVRSSPNLQRLEIAAYRFCNDERDKFADCVWYLKVQEHSEVPVCSNLKYVKIEDFNGFPPEMEFVKLMFSWSPLLDKLVVKSEAPDKLQVLKGLARIRRASTHAVIEFD